MYCLFKCNFYAREYENLGQSFKNWKLFLRMNRISQYLDVAELTDARSENIPDIGYVHTVPDRFLLRFKSCSDTV